MDIMGSKMKTPFAALAESVFASLPLQKEFIKWHFSSRKYSKIAVKRHDPFIRRQRSDDACRYSFLSDSAEPFADPTLSQQNKHFFFDHAWENKGSVQIQQKLIGKIFAVKKHGINI